MLIKLTLAADGQIAITDLHTGQPIQNVGAVTVALAGGMPPEMRLLVNTCVLDMEGRAVVHVVHPLTGTPKPVRSVTFADGEVWEPNHTPTKQ